MRLEGNRRLFGVWRYWYFYWRDAFKSQNKKSFDDSLVKAKAFNHNYINPEHILLSLLDDKGVAYYILETLKLFNLAKNKLKTYLYENKLGK